jgi:hypothetical protein
VHCCLYLAIFGERSIIALARHITIMGRLTALILGALAFAQTSLSSYSTYAPTPAADPNSQFDSAYKSAYNTALENLGGACVPGKVQIRKEW